MARQKTRQTFRLKTALEFDYRQRVQAVRILRRRFQYLPIDRLRRRGVAPLLGLARRRKGLIGRQGSLPWCW